MLRGEKMKKATKFVGLIVASVVCVSAFTVFAACNDDSATKEYTVPILTGLRNSNGKR